MRLDRQGPSNIRVIERGLVPFEASGPNAILMLLIGLLVACFGGFAAGVVREGMDVSVRSPEDVSFVARGARLVLLPETRRRGRCDDDVAATGRTLKPQAKGGVRVERFMLEQPASASAKHPGTNGINYADEAKKQIAGFVNRFAIFTGRKNHCCVQSCFRVSRKGTDMLCRCRFAKAEQWRCWRPFCSL